MKYASLPLIGLLLIGSAIAPTAETNRETTTFERRQCLSTDITERARLQTITIDKTTIGWADSRTFLSPRRNVPSHGAYSMLTEQFLYPGTTYHINSDAFTNLRDIDTALRDAERKTLLWVASGDELLCLISPPLSTQLTP